MKSFRTTITLSVFILVQVHAEYINIDDTTECYLANGADYEGNQNSTQLTNGDDCMIWSTINSTHYADVNYNYCRNFDQSVAPSCYVKDESVNVTKKLCNIPTCNTPAYEGCFNFSMNNTVFFNETSQENDSLMKIERCLNFCRNRKFVYAGLVAGESCYCGGDAYGDAVQNDNLKLPNSACHVSECEDNPSHACGGPNAIAVYNTVYGSCRLTYENVTTATVYSPRWPGAYHANANCTWRIIIPANASKLSIHFKYFHLQENSDTLTFSVNEKVVQMFHGNDYDDFDIDISNVTEVMIRMFTDAKVKHLGFIFNFIISDEDEILATTEPTEIVPPLITFPIVKLTTHTSSVDTVTPPSKDTSTPVGATVDVTQTTSNISTQNTQTKTTITNAVEIATQLSTVGNTGTTNVPGSVTVKPIDHTTQNETLFTSPLPKPRKKRNAGWIIGVILVVIVISMGLLVAGICVQKRMYHKKMDGSNKPPSSFNNPITFNDSSAL